MIACPRITSPGRFFLAFALVVPLALGLASCGKKGSPKPPEGQESDYTYPQPYPAPSSVTPNRETDPATGTNPLSIFTGNDRRTKTTTH